MFVTPTHIPTLIIPLPPFSFPSPTPTHPQHPPSPHPHTQAAKRAELENYITSLAQQSLRAIVLAHQVVSEGDGGKKVRFLGFFMGGVVCVFFLKSQWVGVCVVCVCVCFPVGGCGFLFWSAGGGEGVSFCYRSFTDKLNYTTHTRTHKIIERHVSNTCTHPHL